MVLVIMFEYNQFLMVNGVSAILGRIIPNVGPHLGPRRVWSTFGLPLDFATNTSLCAESQCDESISALSVLSEVDDMYHEWPCKNESILGRSFPRGFPESPRTDEQQMLSKNQRSIPNRYLGNRKIQAGGRKVFGKAARSASLSWTQCRADEMVMSNLPSIPNRSRGNRQIESRARNLRFSLSNPPIFPVHVDENEPNRFSEGTHSLNQTVFLESD